jgi:hypothetical protein
VDAADLCRREDHVAGPLGGEEGLDVGLAGEVELGVGADDDGGEAEREEAAQDRGADEAPVARDEDLGVLVGEEGRVRICAGGGRSGVRAERRREGRVGRRRGLPAAVTVPMSPDGGRCARAAAGDDGGLVG